MEIKPLTNQQAFDMALAGMRAQGWKPSTDADIGCVYRGPSDRKCAAGHLIPDELYFRGLENKTVGGILSRPLEDFLFHGTTRDEAVPKLEAIRDLLGHCSGALLAGMQNIHDGLPSDPDLARKAGEYEFNKLALKSGLVYTPPGA